MFLDYLKKGSLILFFTLTGCVGYSTYEPSGGEPDLDLIHDVRGYKKITDYKKYKITKSEVIKAWGLPEDISVRSWGKLEDSVTKEYLLKNEYWKYPREIAIKGFFPTVMMIPIPIFWYPDGYYNTTIVFNDDYVESANKQKGAYKTGKSCFILIPTYCLDGQGGLH